MKSLFKLFAGLVTILMMVPIVASAFEISPLAAIGVLGVTGVIISVLNVMPTQGVLRAGVLTELWTGELIDKLRFFGKWAAMIPDANQYVGNDAIHLADIGSDPTVLINNTAYPITSAGRTDNDVTVALKKFETTNTPITDDELYALPYDKPGSVINQHRLTLEETILQYGLYSISPNAVSADSPFIDTTGADYGNSRKRMTLVDITNAKTAMDNLKIPFEGRVLVLCNDHMNDLLNFDQAFRDRFYNTPSGQPLNFIGFNIFQDVYNPVYDNTGTKKAWGAAAAPSTDRNASVFFYAPRAFKARGSVKMYYKIAEIDPDNRETKVGFRMRHIILPKKWTGFGAITSTIIP